jgi:hypothetical protein
VHELAHRAGSKASFDRPHARRCARVSSAGRAPACLSTCTCPASPTGTFSPSTRTPPAGIIKSKATGPQLHWQLTSEKECEWERCSGECMLVVVGFI